MQKTVCARPTKRAVFAALALAALTSVPQSAAALDVAGLKVDEKVRVANQGTRPQWRRDSLRGRWLRTRLRGVAVFAPEAEYEQ